MKICSSCGRENPDEARFCLQCGESLSNRQENEAESAKVRSCPKCGKNNGPSAPFCVECGATLSGTVPVERKASKGRTCPKRAEDSLAVWNKLRIAQIILDIALILAAIICIILGMQDMWYLLGIAGISILEYAFPDLHLRYIARYCEKKLELSNEYYIKHYIAGWMITIAGLGIFIYMLISGSDRAFSFI